jgi:hypothetical protein
MASGQQTLSMVHTVATKLSSEVGVGDTRELLQGQWAWAGTTLIKQGAGPGCGRLDHAADAV